MRQFVQLMVTAAAVAVFAILVPGKTTLAAVPSTVAVGGTLISAGGGPAADGNYITLFRLYQAASGGSPVWFEGPLDLAVKNGSFSYTLGSKTSLSIATLAAMPQIWLGVQVGIDPELPRVPLHSVVFALRAASAESLECSGCIGAAQLDPKALAAYTKTADLGAALQNYAQKADLQGYAQAASLAKVAATGDYSDLKSQPKFSDVATTGAYLDLQGLPVLAKVGSACGTGLVVKGIKNDGSLDCISASIGAKDLPADGLDEVSNGLLTTQFTESTVSTTAPIKLPDGQAVGVSDTITVPDFGLAQGVQVSLIVTNSDISKVRVDLYDPNGAKTTIYNGEKAGTKLDLIIATAGTPALDAWVGKNAKGIWSLSVADLVKGAGGFDGQLDSWSIAIKTLSGKKVAATGAFQFYAGTTPPVPCNAANFGAAYINATTKALNICDGKDWAAVYQLGAIGTKDNPGASCKDILTKAPASKDGAYWINPDGTGASQTWCDMTSDGGGWTLAMRLKNDGKLGYASAFWTDKNLLNEDGTGAVDPKLNANAKLGAYVTLPGVTIRGCKDAGPGNCFTQAMGGTKTLQALFNENFKAGGPSRGTLTAIWGDDGSQPNCNVSGINNFSSYGGSGTYSAARWGLVGNNEGDCATTDSGWGFGVYGCSDTAKTCGAGGAFWQSGACGLNCTQGTLWVR